MSKCSFLDFHPVSRWLEVLVLNTLTCKGQVVGNVFKTSSISQNSIVFGKITSELSHKHCFFVVNFSIFGVFCGSFTKSISI